MTPYISPVLRATANQANFRCEYCRLPESAAMLKFQIEHIISLQHGGKTTLSNLAYSCPICNANKGSNLGTILQDEETIVPFYHPRKHLWNDHFEVRDGQFYPKPPLAKPQ